MNIQNLSSAAIGTLIGGICSVIILLITNFHNNRRHSRELAFQAAMEVWRRACVTTDATNRKIDSSPEILPGIRMPPLNDPEFVRILDAVTIRLAALK